MKILRARKQSTTALAFNAACDKLAVGGRVRVPEGRNKGRIDVWDLSHEDRQSGLASLPEFVDKVAFTPDGSVVAVALNRIVLFSGPDYCDAQVIEAWDQDHDYRVVTPVLHGSRLVIQSVRMLRMIDTTPPFHEIWRSPATINSMWSKGGVALSPDATKLAVPCVGTVEIRECSTGNVVATFEKPRPDIRFLGYHLYWTADGRWIVEPDAHWVNVWDAHSGRHVFQLILCVWPMSPTDGPIVHPSEPPIGVLFHEPSGRLGIATHVRLRIFDPKTWQEEPAEVWPHWPINRVAMASTGTIAAGGDHGVALFEMPW